jgi:hypothetical protein
VVERLYVVLVVVGGSFDCEDWAGLYGLKT